MLGLHHVWLRVFGSVLKGSLPERQLRLILAWNELRHDELVQNWELVRENQSFNQINPL